MFKPVNWPLSCVSGVILFIGIVGKVMSRTGFEYKHDVASFPVRVVFMVSIHKEYVTHTNITLKILKYT